MVEVIKQNRWGIFILTGLLWMLSNVIVLIWGPLLFSSKFDPYGDVVVVRNEQEGPKRLFTAHFTKYECDIEALRVLVSYPGIGVVIVDWESLSGLPSGNQIKREEYYNRSPGAQTLNIQFPLGPDFEWYEIRTSHLCPLADAPNRERVPKIFIHVKAETPTIVDKIINDTAFEPPIQSIDSSDL